MPGTNHFNDVVGYCLLGGSIISFIMIFLVVKILDNPKILSIAILLLFGLSLVLFGIWVFGEKQRFAALPVNKTKATITYFDGYGCYGLSVRYNYKDQTGGTHYGNDVINEGATIAKAKAEKAISINYLISNPDISRIVEYDTTLGNTFRAILIILGLLFMFFPIYGKRFFRFQPSDEKINKNMDDWMASKEAKK